MIGRRGIVAVPHGGDCHHGKTERIRNKPKKVTLARKDRQQGLVQERGRHGEYGGVAAGAQSICNSLNRREGKQKRIQIRGPLDREAGALQDRGETGSRVAAFVMVDFVVTAPQELIRGNGHQEAARRAQKSEGVPEKAEIIVDMLDDVEEGDKVESLLRMRVRIKRALNDIVETPLAAVFHGQRRCVGAGRSKLGRTIGEKCACPASHVKDG